MSIFKDTFRKYVRDQISLREELIDIGNNNNRFINEDGIDKFSRLKSAKNVKLQSGTVVKDLDAGAHYTYTLNKQCILL